MSVVVTGIGVIVPGAIGLDALWDALLAGRSALAPLTRVDTTGLPCRTGGEIHDPTWVHLVPSRQRRTLPRVTQLARAAAQLARDDAGLDGVAPERLGVAIGTALGGWVDGEAQYRTLMTQGPRRVNPFVATAAPYFASAAAVATALDAQGPQLTFATGCAAGLQAIGHAAALIAAGELDVCIAGGVECPLSPVVLAGMGRMGELSESSRPFDRGHDGMVLTEGAALLVLESAAHAAGRGAAALAEIGGTASSCDARGLHRVDESGETAARALAALLERTDARLDWVCAHANGAPVFDRKEAAVLRAALGSTVDTVAVSSIKGVFGHALGASAPLQAATVVAAMRHGHIPHTHNLDDPDPACALDHVRDRPRECAVQTALVTSYGYGGVNGFLVLRAR